MKVRFRRLRFGTLFLLMSMSGPFGLAQPSKPNTVSPPDPIPIVHVAWMGDVMLADGPGRFIRAGGDPFNRFAPLLDAADLRVANLECVIATSGKPRDKPWTFRAHPAVVDVLKRHVDVVSVANNHSGDYGREAFAEMLSRLGGAGISFFGGGLNLRQAHRPLIVERKGIRMAFLGYDDFFPRSFEAGPDRPGVAWAEEEQMTYDIREARRQADIVIPFMHWGQEHETRANERQRQLARLMIDAGADAVVGTHPHVVQDTETYRGKPIFYSLGNFVFDGFSAPVNNTGWVLQLDLTRQGVLSWKVSQALIDKQGSPRLAQRPEGLRKKVE